MRIVRYTAGLLTGLVALVLTVVLFFSWFSYASGLAAAAGGALAYAFLWLAFGANLLLWTAMGLLRLTEETARSVLRRRPRAGGRRAVSREGSGDRVLVAAGAAGGSGSASELSASGHAEGAATALADTGQQSSDVAERGSGGVEAAVDEDLSLAVVIPAHNEEPVIDGAIASALRLFDRWDIYVVSDSSGDATAEIAANTGVNVLELLTNRGKAGAIEAVIEEFALTDHYDGVVILDADTELDEGYVRGAKRQLRDPAVAAVAGFVVSEWKPWERTFVGRLISSYRDRLYFLLQYFMRFGQTWKRTNTSFIVPGFASVYRSSALREVDINPKGLVIEDFNMTFEVQRKRLGKISMRPDTKAYSQDPFTFRDYYKQVGRWTLGFWQTVRRHRVWASVFWLALALYIVEVVVVAFTLLATTLIGVFVLVGTLWGETALTVPYFGDGFTAVSAFLPLTAIVIGLFVPDYMLTCVMAMVRRRPSYLLYGLFFFPIRLVDAYLSLRMIPRAWTASSDGRWSSPIRVSNKS
ncbi:glycosyltransferase family 2 protein [Nocardiopsis aegyptia]|uniref:Cellulose synthase/poly-beta-1,6-N-acetylglucosamine synthase-like glycosyltransferase n=1 Tax=Nocardiopsis aegyptia TaxID=220378 RepID=A0A7Z0EPW6_9ACTN|nr:glycosyltransferase family 2 protein [Nocardiopsis aegyptia]NYJ35511.1 cellulose synthase/poly-beta-1,6-N-acetylglucosamine synthase-like glycosyltransferase [Nocardiopsis aegyptia]